MNKKAMIKNVLRLWIMFDCAEAVEDGIADMVRVKNNKAFAYYIYNENNILKKATDNAVFYDESYVVFGSEDDYIKQRDFIPPCFGVVLCGDIHRLGGAIELKSRPARNEVLDMVRITVLPALSCDHNKYYAVLKDDISLPLLKRSGYTLNHKPNLTMIGYTRKTWLLNPHTKAALDAAPENDRPVTFKEYLNLFR